MELGSDGLYSVAIISLINRLYCIMATNSRIQDIPYRSYWFKVVKTSKFIGLAKNGLAC